MEATDEISLLIEGQVFKARKDTLIEHSDYFRAMFSGNYVENEQVEISIDVVGANAMAIILKYIKLGIIDVTEHSLSTIEDVAVAANFLQLTEFFKQVEYCLEVKLALNNWLKIKEIAQIANSAKLEQASIIYGLNSFNFVKPQYIPTLNELYWYLSHPYLNTDSELQVFKFGLEWVEHKEMGADTLLVILCCLEISKLTYLDLREMISLVQAYKGSLVEKVINCLHKIAFDFELSVTGIEKNKGRLCRFFAEEVYTEVLNLVKESIQRKLKLVAAVPMCATRDERPETSPNYLYTYTNDTGFHKWIEISEKNLWGWSVAAWNSTKVVMVGGEYGRGSGNFMQDVREYDINKKEWIHHGVKIPVRRHASVVIVGDLLFMLGGVGGYSIKGLFNAAFYSILSDAYVIRYGAVRTVIEPKK